MQRKPLRTQGEKNKPGDEEAVCVLPFPVFPSCPMLASVSLVFPFLYVFVTLSLLGFLLFLLLCSASVICKKNESKARKR
jgi:hypothetical protein